MKTKAKLAWIAGVLGAGALLHGQTTTNPTMPTVPRGDGTGSALPSMNPATGDARGSTNARAAGDAPGSARAGAAARPTTDRSREAARARVGTIDENPADRPTAQVDTGAAVMNTTAFSHEIRILRYNAREELLAQLEARLSGNERELNEVRQSAPRLTGDARTAYRQALQDLKAKREALHHAIKAARKASPETWETARTALASGYEAYSIALTRLEATPAVPVAP